MRRSSRIRIRRLDDFFEQDPIHVAQESIGGVLTIVAIALVVAIVLVAESRLPEDLRIGAFEATYASP